MALHRSGEYDASAMMADTPLSAEEIEDVLNTKGKGFIKDQRKVMHFVRRALITIQAYRQQLRSLQYDIAEERNVKTRAGVASTLSPLDSLKFLSDEQAEAVFQAHFKEKLRTLDVLKAKAEEDNARLNNERNRIRFTVSSIMEDDTVDDNTKAKLRALMDFGQAARPSEGAGPVTRSGAMPPASSGEPLNQPPPHSMAPPAPGVGSLNVPGQPPQSRQPSGEPEAYQRPASGPIQPGNVR